MKAINQFLFVILLFVASMGAFAQVGVFDPTFQAANSDAGMGFEGPVFDSLPGFSGRIWDMIIQEDGKAVIIGDFHSYNGISTPGIARLDVNGDKDLSFKEGRGFNGTPTVILRLNNGKLLVGGDFTNYNGMQARRIVRLNANGSRDISFNYEAGFDNIITSMVLQPDGKILVGGLFTRFGYNNDRVNFLLRLNSNGDSDNTFKPRADFDHPVNAIGLQRDGKILINSGNQLFRLNRDGSRDDSFSFSLEKHPDYPAKNGDISTILLLRSIIVQQDEKILLAGKIQIGSHGVSLLSINQEGIFDPDFNSPKGVTYDAVVDAQGRIYTMGSDSDGTEQLFTRLQPNGLKDASYPALNPIRVEDQFKTVDGKAMALKEDGGLLVSSSSSDGNGLLLSLKTDGAIDISYNPIPGFNGRVLTMDIQNDGKIVVGGDFTVYNGKLVRGITRLNPDGTVDVDFNIEEGLQVWSEPNLRFNGSVNKLGVQKDGKIIASGYFNAYNGKQFTGFHGEPPLGLIRLNSDGSQDDTFITGSGIKGTVYSISFQEDGKILFSGDFTEFNGRPSDGVLRLNPDGTMDNSFFPDSYFYANSESILLPNNKILLTGFTGYDGRPVRRVIRLNEDGSHDASFRNSSNLRSIQLQSDGKIVGIKDEMLNRLLPDGLQDPAFKDDSKNSSIQLFSLLSDGKIIGITTDWKVVKFLSDGSLDPSFSAGGGFNSEVQAIISQPDDKIITAGSYTKYNIINSYGITRLLTSSEEPLPLKEVIRINAGGEAIESQGEHWQADAYYNGGKTFASSAEISLTENDILYQTERYGDFSYDIPVPAKGYYTVELHFAEIYWKDPDSRLFTVHMEEEEFIVDYDLIQEAGGINIALVLKVENIRVTDGKLTVSFYKVKDRAKISGIAVFQQDQLIAPDPDDIIRINAGGGTLYHGNEVWLADSYFTGGDGHKKNVEILYTERDALYKSERYGEFTYRLPASAPGLYTVELHFAEIWDRYRTFGFDIEKRQYSMEFVDLFKDYGGLYSATVMVFENIEVNDGFLDINFFKQNNNATVAGIAMFKQQETIDSQLPAIINLNDVSIEIDVNWNYQVEVINAEAVAITFSAEGLPRGLSIDPVSGLISGRPQSKGESRALIRIQDQAGNVATTAFYITVYYKEMRINSSGFDRTIGDEEWISDSYSIDGFRHGLFKELVVPPEFEKYFEIYYPERVGKDRFSYEIPVYQNGYFTVELYANKGAFGDYIYTKPGEYSIQIENRQYVNTVENFRNGSDQRPTPSEPIIVRNLKVEDGFLSIDFVRQTGSPRISGIVIKREVHLPPYRINAGGDAFKFENENWGSDQYYSGGLVHRDRSIRISDTKNDLLYQSERFGDFSYSIPAPEEGLYTLELHFAEIYWDKEGERIFDLTVENQQVTLENMDLFQRYGPRTAGVMTVENIEVIDGLMDIEVKKKINNPTLSGIVMYKQEKKTEGAGTPNLRSLMIEQNNFETEEVTSTTENPRVTRLYPNPTRDRFSLGFNVDRAGEWDFTLMSSLGVTLFQDQRVLETGYNLLEFELSNLPLSPGIYYFMIRSDNRAPIVKKLMIK